jgi:branched-chain amino acid transport system permease protein
MAENKKDKLDIPPATALGRVLPMWITFAVVAMLGPWLFSAYWLNTFSTVACLTLAAGTVALLYGQLGMVSLAQFALAGVGGWACLRLIHATGVPFELGLIFGALIAGVAGLLVGLPALRMRGLYLALITLMVAAAFQVVVNVNGFPDGGPGFIGKTVVGSPKPIDRPWLATSDAGYFRYVMVWLGLGMGLIEWQRASLAGRSWALIRKSEAAAIAAGVSVLGYKAWAFTLAGALAGLAGGLIAGLNGRLDFSGFQTSQSILLYALTVVGGAYHWMGAVFSGLLMRAMPALLNDHGVDGNLANVFYGFALLVSLIQGRKGLAGQLADFYKFVRMSRIVEGTLSWGAIAIVLGLLCWALGLASFGGAVFIALIALLFRQAIPGVCWLLLGFFGKRVQDGAEDLEGAASLRLARFAQARGWPADHRFLKRCLNVLFIGLFVAWVALRVFDVPFPVGLAIIWAAIALKSLLEIALYPHVLPWRKRIDARWPKPFASYR